MPSVKRAVKAPMLDSALAYLYAPFSPLLQRVALPRRAHRRPEPGHVRVPAGYAVEVVATGFDAPVHCTFDDAGACYVSECGHKIESPPRIVKVDVRTGARTTVYELPEDRWRKTGALTGACWHDGALYFSETDRVARLRSDGVVEEVVGGLPGLGDHQTNHPVVGPDGRLYWGQGTATNTGIVGADNAAYEWLPKFPRFHDVPAADVRLAGRSYEYQDVLGSVTDTVRSGAYSPFGVATPPGTVVRGDVRCTGAVLSCEPDGSGLEVVCWGLRNPYGLAFAPDGRLFATEHGIDERSARYVVGDPDDLYEIRRGTWYGWPDFAAGVRLDDPRWGDKDSGRGREPVLAEHPDEDPPMPFATFEAHSGSNGFDFSRDAAFGFEGDAFVALFGDVAPVTTRTGTPRGFKVARVDMRTGAVTDFAVNRVAGPSSKLPHRGLERPSHCAFGPDGALYVVDFGEIQIAPEVGGIRVRRGSGVLWRIRRTDGPAGEAPPPAVVLPVYGIRAALVALVLVAAIVAAIVLVA